MLNRMEAARTVSRHEQDDGKDWYHITKHLVGTIDEAKAAKREPPSKEALGLLSRDLHHGYTRGFHVKDTSYNATVSCKEMVYDDVDFIKRVEILTWARLWIYDTTLKPWHRNKSITSADIIQMIPDMCMLHVGKWNPKRPTSDKMTRYCSLCNACHQVQYQVYVMMLLGARGITKADWNRYVKGESAFLSSHFNLWLGSNVGKTTTAEARKPSISSTVIGVIIHVAAVHATVAWRPTH